MYRGFSRLTGPSGWFERDGKRFTLTGWELVGQKGALGRGHGWFRCQNNDFLGRAGQELELSLRDWDLRVRVVPVRLTRIRDAGGICEFVESAPSSILEPDR
jgi:hypothetical protein